MQTMEELQKMRKDLLIGTLVLGLITLGSYSIWQKIHSTPTYGGGGTLTNYTETLKEGYDYTLKKGKIQNLPDTEYLGYFTYLKEGFNEHTISLTTQEKPRSITKHVLFDTDNDEVTNTFSAEGIVIDTNYKVTETKNKSLGVPTPNVKQTFTLTNTTDEDQTVTFTSRTKLQTNTVEYNGRTITITDTPITLKAEEKTASIPEFASDIGYEDPEATRASYFDMPCIPTPPSYLLE